MLLLAACATNEAPNTSQKITPIAKNKIKLQQYVEQLSSSVPSERAWAVYNIGKYSKFARNTVPSLIAVLGDNATAVMSRNVGKDFSSGTTTTTASEAVKTLAKIGLASVKPLIKALKDSNNNVVQKAIRTLGLIGHSDSIKPLVQFLTHQEMTIRLEAANSLSRIKNPWVAEYFLKALENDNPNVRSTALYGLGKMNNPVAIPGLLKLINDPNVAVRSQVIYVLSKSRDVRVIEPLIKQSSSGDVEHQVDVIQALGNIRDYRVIEQLLVLLKDNNKKIKVASASALSQISDVDFGVNFSKWQHWWQEKLRRSKGK